MNRRRPQLLQPKWWALAWLICGSTTHAAALPNQSIAVTQLPKFVIHESASAADWQYFMQQPFTAKQDLWNYHSTLGRSLKDWHWQWRLGWIRACAHRQHLQTKLCQQIITLGETDKAMVVRGTLARIFGEIYQGRAHQPTIIRLKRMFANPQNYRHGKPLFVNYTILGALAKIGGTTSQQLTYQLASQHPQTLAYYHQHIKSPHHTNRIQP